MPKKTRKAKERAAERRMITQSSAPPVETSTAALGGTMGASTAGSPMLRAATRTSSAIPRGDTLWLHDYEYVLTDLRRIAILAALFFVAMIALYFVIK